jgi:hypothetical protein
MKTRPMLLAVAGLAALTIAWLLRSSDEAPPEPTRYGTSEQTVAAEDPERTGGPLEVHAFSGHPEASGPSPERRSSLVVLDRKRFRERAEELGIEDLERVLERLHRQRPDRGALVAVVTNEAWQPIPGATVTLDPAQGTNLLHRVNAGESSPWALRQLTGEGGMATFENLPGGRYFLTVEHPDHLTFSRGQLAIQVGAPTFVEARLVTGDSVIAGEVLDEGGRGLEAVAVEAHRYVEGGAPFTVRARTDLRGRFSLSVEEAAQYEVRAEKVGYADVAVKGVAAGTGDLRLVMKDAAVVTVEGRCVEAGSEEPLAAFTIDEEAVQDPEGRFSVDRNRDLEGGCELVFAAPGCEPRTMTVPANGKPVVDLGTVALAPSRELNGLVVGREGSLTLPVGGATVALSGDGLRPDSMTTSPEGVFSFRGLDAERVTLTVNAVGYRPKVQRVDLGGARTTNVEIALDAAPVVGGAGRRAPPPAPGGISGRIVDGADDEPLEGVLIEVVEDPERATVTSSIGTFSLAAAGLERVTLRASKEGYREKLSPTLTPGPEGALWNASLDPSGLRFLLTSAESPVPAGTGVVLWKGLPPGDLAAALQAQADLENHRFEAETDADGEVAFDVPDGKWFVQVPTYRLHPLPVLADPQNAERKQLELPGRTRLTGRVRTSNGQPVANTGIWLHSGDQDYSTMFLHHTDAQGRYEIPHLAPRPYALSIIKNNAVQSAQHVVEFQANGAPTQTLDVSFPPLTSSITGRLTDPAGVGRPGIQIGVEWLDAPHRSILAGWVVTGPDGSFTVPFLEPGSHRVRTAWADDANVFSEVLTLQPGVTTQVDLVMPRVRGKVVSGHLLAPDGGPLGGNFCFATDSSGRQNGNFFSTMDWAYVGPFSIKGLAPDTYTFTFTAMGCRKQTRSLPVFSDRSGITVTMPRE